MAEETTIRIPKVNWKSVLEFMLDALIVIVVFNLAGKFFLASNVPITAQLTEFVIVLGITAIAVKYVLATKIVKG